MVYFVTRIIVSILLVQIDQQQFRAGMPVLRYINTCTLCTLNNALFNVYKANAQSAKPAQVVREYLLGYN